MTSIQKRTGFKPTNSGSRSWLTTKAPGPVNQATCSFLRHFFYHRSKMTKQSKNLLALSFSGEEGIQC